MKAEYILNEQIELILLAMQPENAVVIKAALETGLRVSDLLDLTPDKIKDHCWIKEQKTGKARQIGFSRKLQVEIRQFSSAWWAFPGRDPRKHRTRQAVWKDIKRVSRALRFPQNITVHSARKVYAARLFEQYGGDLSRVQRALNHSSPAVSAVYALAAEMLTRKYPRLGKNRLTK